MSIEPERRVELLKAKLIGIVKSAGYDATEIKTEHNNSDAVLLTKDRCWVLAGDENPQSVLGKGIFLLTRNPELELCVVFEDIEAAGIAARQAIGLKGETEIMYFLEGKLTQVSPTPFPDTPNTPTLSENSSRVSLSTALLKSCVTNSSGKLEKPPTAVTEAMVALQ